MNGSGYRGKPGLLPILLAVSLGVLLCAPNSTRAEDEGVYRFLIPAAEAEAGESVRLTIQGEHAESAQGFSMALRYPASEVTIDRIHIEDTILEAIETDFVEPLVSVEDGTIVIGVLVDAAPPFEGQLIPNIGMPLDFIHIEMTVSPEATGDLVFSFENNISTPRVDNLYSVDNESIPVSELGEGILRVRGAGGHGAGFVRGDFNLDTLVNISDPISILHSLFAGTEPAPCVVAGDVNDDEKVDISDPIFLLKHLFQNGPRPPPPEIYPGQDPTPGPLSCEEQLEG